MPTPAESIRLAEIVAQVYAEAAAELVALVGQTALTQDLVRLRREAERIAQRATAAGGMQAVAVVSDAFEAGARGRAEVNQRAVLALAQGMLGQLQQAGPAMLRWAEDVYRQVVAQATLQGLATLPERRKITAQALDRFAALGVTGFRSRDGSMLRIESYTEMATRTALQRAHLAGTIDRLTGQGRDLVVVSTSPAGCPLCRPHEGKVFSLSGRDPDHPPLSSASGLFHPNCTHSVSAFIPGLTQDPPGTPEGSPALYEARQRQRALERAVRESKRRVAAAEAVGDPHLLAQQRQLLAVRQARLRAHLRANPRLKSYVSRQRTQVVLPKPPQVKPLQGDEAYQSVPDVKLTGDQRKALTYYQGRGYFEVNMVLREGRVAAYPTDKHLGHLQTVMDRLPPLERPLVAWRGVKDYAAVFGDLRPGAVIHDKGFVSTSVHRATAERFIRRNKYQAPRTPALFRVTVPRGGKALRIPGKQFEEAELLLPPGSRFRVTKVTRVDSEDGDRMVVDLEVIP